MACSTCSKGRTAKARMAVRQAPGNHSYPLVSFPDCTELYTGDVRDSIIIVGYQTDDEKLFARRDLAAASTYAKEKQLRGSPIMIANSSLCDDAVRSVYG